MLVPFLEKYSTAFPARCWPWSPRAVYWYQSHQAWPRLPWLEKCWLSSNPWKDQNYDNCLSQYTAVCIMWNSCYIKVSAWKSFFLKQLNLFQRTCARCCSHEYISKQRASVGRLLGSLFLPYPSPVLTSTGQEFCSYNYSIIVDQINTHLNILNKDKRSNSQDKFQSFPVFKWYK